MISALGLDLSHHWHHPVHGAGNTWLETNCATDLWIEVLHAVGLDPLPGLAFTVGTDFTGDQWTMFTYPAEDLRLLYGVEVHELNVWRPFADHLEELLGLGQLVSFDVDGFYLPDTEGNTYRQHHQKTTICAEGIDPARRHLRYFHNAELVELAGEDYDAVLGVHAGEAWLPPYSDQIRLDTVEGSGPTLSAVVERLALHLRRRPTESPVHRLAKRITADLEWLSGGGMEVFHRYAFGTVRQLGAAGQLAAGFTGWLDEHDGGGLDGVTAAFEAVSDMAHAVEFMLARAVAGRRVELDGVMADIDDAWSSATEELTSRYA